MFSLVEAAGWKTGVGTLQGREQKNCDRGLFRKVSEGGEVVFCHGPACGVDHPFESLQKAGATSSGRCGEDPLCEGTRIPLSAARTGKVRVTFSTHIKANPSKQKIA